MSTQEIGELIESVNRLTQTVAGKMGEIDKKVDQATASVPNTIRSMASVSFFVSNSGSDTDGTGTQWLPFKTIKHAISQAMPGSLVNIFIEDNQEYICESNEHNNICNGKDILISTYGSTGVKPKLRFRMTQNPNGAFNGAYVCNYFEGSRFSLTITKIDLIHEPIPEGGLPYSSDSYGGVVTRGTSSAGGIDVTLRLSDCSVLTGDHPFVTGQMGYLNIHLSTTPITKGGTSERFLPVSGIRMGRIIGLYAVSISGFTSNAPKDVFQYDETKIASVLGGGLS